MSNKLSKYKTSNYFSDDEDNDKYDKYDNYEDNDNDEADDNDDAYDNDNVLDDTNELDDETKILMYNSLQNKKYDMISKFEEKQRTKNNELLPNIKQQSTKSTKATKSLSLIDFNNMVDTMAKAKANQVKKFVSKRADDKRKELDIIENTGPKRCFNPRLQPYNFVHDTHKYMTNIEMTDEVLFPSIK